MSEVLSGSRIVRGTVGKDRLTTEFQAELGNLLTTTAVQNRIDTALASFRAQLFGGEVELAWDTIKEIVDGLKDDRNGLNALTQALNNKATPQDVATAVTAIIGTATNEGNTLGKLQALVEQVRQVAVNAIADGVITNAKLAADVKVGSLNAAANAYPVAVQPGLTSVEKFLVYLSQQLSAVQASAGTSQNTGSNHESRLVTLEQMMPTKASAADLNTLSQRVTTAEQNLAGKASTLELTNLSGRVSTLEGRSTTPTGGTATGGSGAFTGTFNGVNLSSNGDGTRVLRDNGTYGLVTTTQVVTSTDVSISVDQLRSQFRFNTIRRGTVQAVTPIRNVSSVALFVQVGSSLLPASDVNAVNAILTARSAGDFAAGIAIVGDVTLIPGQSSADLLLSFVYA